MMKAINPKTKAFREQRVRKEWRRLFEQLDYRLNPRNGYRIDVEASAGNKEILPNIDLNPILYDSLELTSLQIKTSGQLEAFIPTTKRTTINVQFQGGYILNDQVFNNELFRIGGFKTLRGFDEESIQASGFARERAGTSA